MSSTLTALTPMVGYWIWWLLAPGTPNSRLQTGSPTLSTPNPKPQTLNPQPSTLNPNP